MLAEIGLVFLAHGVTSLLVHGLPAMHKVQGLSRENSLIGLSLFWVINYSIFTPFTFYRLFQRNDKWIWHYAKLLSLR